jgi:glycerate 2-kinase
VTNPLIGETGSVYTFARQKGATEEQLVELEKGMTILSELLQKKYSIDPNEITGSGVIIIIK